MWKMIYELQRIDKK